MSTEATSEKNFTEYQLYMMGTVYDTLARLLPVEGRDYTIEFSFNSKTDPEELAFSFKPHTELGEMWCNYCRKEFAKMGGHA